MSIVTSYVEPEDFYGPIVRPSVKPYKYLGILQVFDVATTYWILSTFVGASEQNPVVDFVFSRIGIEIGCLILLALKLGIVYLACVRRTENAKPVKIVAAIYSLVVFNNLLFAFLYFTS